jgi:hypothetical protein
LTPEQRLPLTCKVRLSGLLLAEHRIHQQQHRLDIVPIAMILCVDAIALAT